MPAGQETQPVATVPAQLLAPPQATALQCNRTRRPMHVVMTAATGLYQEWQSRIAYYHYKKMKRLHPCSDLGGFTRLYNSYNAAPDSLMEEIPTLVVKQLGHGNCAECDRGFIVMNRPWGAVQVGALSQPGHAPRRGAPPIYEPAPQPDHALARAVTLRWRR